MNGKKARKLRKVSEQQFEANDYKTQRIVFRDLKKMYKNKEISVK